MNIERMINMKSLPLSRWLIVAYCSGYPFICSSVYLSFCPSILCCYPITQKLNLEGKKTSRDFIFHAQIEDKKVMISGQQVKVMVTSIYTSLWHQNNKNNSQSRDFMLHSHLKDKDRKTSIDFWVKVHRDIIMPPARPSLTVSVFQHWLYIFADVGSQVWGWGRWIQNLCCHGKAWNTS